MLAVPQSAPARPRIRRFLLVLVALILALVVAELSMRRYALVPRALDPDLGYVATGRTHWHREGEAEGNWLARGVRAPSVAVPLEEEGKRILVIGDSFTEAPHVSDAEVYTDVAERLLRAQGRRVRVMNVGVLGQSVGYYVHLAPKYRRIFTPDWVIVQVGEDDLLAEAFNKKATHFERLESGGLRVKALPPEGGGGLLRATFRLLSGRSALLQNLVLQQRGFAAMAGKVRPFHEADTLAPPPPKRPWRYPIREELRALANAYDNRLTLLFLSSANPQSSAPPSATELVVRDACVELGLSCAFTHEENAKLARSGAFPTGFPNTRPYQGHLNPAGHAAAARALVQVLSEGRPGAVL
jgi:lysophospholipase L1-like esterase